MILHYKRTESPKRRLQQKQTETYPFPDLGQAIPLKMAEDARSTQIIEINAQNVVQNLQLYAWRSRTYLPVLKPTHIVLSPSEKPNLSDLQFHLHLTDINEPSTRPKYNRDFLLIKDFVLKSKNVTKYKVQVQTQKIKCTLKQTNELPLPQILHLLKELLISFQVLVSVFGYFLLTDEMVAVSVASQWRVWVNQNFIKNEKIQGFQSQQQFLEHVYDLVEKHCLVTTTSRLFFNQIRELVSQKSATFLKVLAKINQFITVNKVFQVNKVLLPITRMSKPSISHKNSVQFPAIRNLSSDDKASPMKRQQNNHFQPQFHKTYNPLQKSNFNPITRNSIYGQQTFNNNISTVLKPTSFQHLPSNFHSKQLWPYKSQKLIFSTEFHSPKAVQTTKHINTPTKELEQSINFTPKHKSHTNFFNLAQSDKLFSPKIKLFASAEINRYKPIKFPTAFKFTPTQLRRNNVCPQIQLTKTIQFNEMPLKVQRKYSDKLQKIKSAEALLKMQNKITESSIYQPDCKAKLQLKRHLSSKQHQGYQVKIQHNKNSSQLSPNNSSSTKEVKNSDQFIPAYLKMKQKDLVPNKAKNNLSFVNNNVQPVRGKNLDGSDNNMAISYQFQTKDPPAKQKFHHQNEDYRQGSNNHWINSISGLFSDTISIKHLKESLKFKTQQQEPFQKQYLKQIKLDKLQKFGRKVNHMVIQQDESKYPSPNQFRSMQLIEQQTQQVKSYLQSQRRDEQDLKSKGTRSKHQTVQLKPQCHDKVKQETYSQQHRSQYDDNDAQSQIASLLASKDKHTDEIESEEDTGFCFQTEMYVINPKTPH